jgi:hypothetical protein
MLDNPDQDEKLKKENMFTIDYMPWIIQIKMKN